MSDPSPNLEPSLSVGDVLGIVRSLVKYPLATVCRHHVAAQLLSVLESRGWDCPGDLAGAVVDADDAMALKLLDEMGREI